MAKADFIGVGFVSNDHLAVLPFIPMDTKVKMLSHRILGGGLADGPAVALRVEFLVEYKQWERQIS